ncbi:MAG: hypothetical protein CL700_06940, partial [Chloroflexi bacterium]|nr:hypothetical protein [Chloroflexota bacterium]
MPTSGGSAAGGNLEESNNEQRGQDQGRDDRRSDDRHPGLASVDPGPGRQQQFQLRHRRLRRRLAEQVPQAFRRPDLDRHRRHRHCRQRRRVLNGHRR